MAEASKDQSRTQVCHMPKEAIKKKIYQNLHESKWCNSQTLLSNIAQGNWRRGLMQIQDLVEMQGASQKQAEEEQQV